MTWLDLARRYYPEATDEELDAVLWCATCFPFGTIEQVKGHLIEAKRAHCRTVDEAIARVDRKIEALL